MTASGAEKAEFLETFKRAQVARAAKDLSAARDHLHSALTLVPGEPPVWLKLFEVELLRDEGRAVEARELLQSMRLQYPDNLWPAFHLAGLARKEGDRETAWMHLEAILALGAAEQNVWVRLLEADLLEDEGRHSEVRGALERAAHAFPVNIVPHQRLARLAEREGNLPAARAHYENALTIDPSQVTLHLAVTRLLQSEGWSMAAIQRLEILHTRFSDDMRILMQLVALYRAEKDTDREQDWLAKAVEVDALHGGLLRHLFATRARTVAYEELLSTLAQLRPAVDPGLAHELRVALLLQAMAFQEVLPVIRQDRKSRKSAGEARQLARALFGAHRYDLGLRYLRFCLRRWPEDEGLWSVYVTQALKLGWPDAVARQLDQGAARLPEHVVLAHRFMLAGFRNDLEGAVACYEGLRALKRDLPAL